AALHGELHRGALVRVARAAPHDAVADLHLRALLEGGDLEERARVVAAPHFGAARLSVARDPAALGERRRGDGELGAAADAPVPADVDAVAVAFLADHRAFDREALDDVARDIAHRVVDAARAARAPDLREDDLAVRGVELHLGQVAVVGLGDAAEHDHVDGRAQRRVLPALGHHAVDVELALRDLRLQRLLRNLAEPGEAEQVVPERLLGLRRDVLQVDAGRVAGEAVDRDADRPGRGRVEVALEIDVALDLDGRLPRARDVAGRRHRDRDFLARLAAVGIRIGALRVGLADVPAVDAHGEARDAAPPAVLLGQRLDREQRLAVQADLDRLAGLERVGRAVAAVAGLGDGELGSLRRLLLVGVDELALGVGDADRFSARADLGFGERRVLVGHAQGDVARRVELGVEAVGVRLAFLRELHEEARLPRLDAVAGHLLAHRQVDLGARLLAHLLREHALRVGDADLLAVEDHGGLRHRLAVDAGVDLDVDALAARREECDEGQCEKTRKKFFHGDPLVLTASGPAARAFAHIAGAWMLTSPGLMILSSSVAEPLIDLRRPSSIFFSLIWTLVPKFPTSTVWLCGS